MSGMDVEGVLMGRMSYAINEVFGMIYDMVCWIWALLTMKTFTILR